MNDNPYAIHDDNIAAAVLMTSNESNKPLILVSPKANEPIIKAL